jgi:hypothetical protein
MTHGCMNLTISAPIALVAELREFAEAEKTKVSYVLRDAFLAYKRAKIAAEKAEVEAV